MDNRKQKEFDIWDCDNEHQWLSYPGPYKDTWHLEQLHESESGTFMERDPKSAWLVAGVDPSICPLCAMRMQMRTPRVRHNAQTNSIEITQSSKKISG